MVPPGLLPLHAYFPSSDFTMAAIRMPRAVLVMRPPGFRSIGVEDPLAVKYQDVTGFGVPTKSQLNSTDWPITLVLFEGTRLATGLPVKRNQ